MQYFVPPLLDDKQNNKQILEKWKFLDMKSKFIHLHHFINKFQVLIDLFYKVIQIRSITEHSGKNHNDLFMLWCFPC